MKMKQIVLTLLLAAGITSASAQVFTGEMRAARSNPKYLAGSVPVVDSMVVLTREVPLSPDVDRDSAFVRTRHWLGRYLARPSVLRRKTIVVDSTTHVATVAINEYITFTANALNLDRSQMLYTLSIGIAGDRATITMTDISYYYEEERTPLRYTAEEWITDRHCLNRRGTRLHVQNGKFRIKTIDHIDQTAESLAEALK